MWIQENRRRRSQALQGEALVLGPDSGPAARRRSCVMYNRSCALLPGWLARVVGSRPERPAVPSGLDPRRVAPDPPPVLASSVYVSCRSFEKTKAASRRNSPTRRQATSTAPTYRIARNAPPAPTRPRPTRSINVPRPAPPRPTPAPRLFAQTKCEKLKLIQYPTE